MLGFFRINVADRWLFLLALIVLISLPAYFLGIEPTIPQEIAKQVGHRLSEGNWLYRDCHTETGPLSALVYALLAFSGSYIDKLSLVFAWLMLVLQGYLFIQLVLKYEVFTERNYVAGLVFMILALSCFPFLIVSDVSIGSTFILIALLRVIKHLRSPIAEDEMLFTGTLIGLATLSFIPLLLFMVVPILAFSLYTGTTLRQYFLLSLGFFLPLLIMGLVFFMGNMYGFFYDDYLTSIFHLQTAYYASIELTGVYIFIPFLFMVFAFLAIANNRKFINFQVSVQVTMFIILIIGLLVIVVSPFRSLSTLELFILPATYFITQFLYLVKRKWLAESTLLLWLVVSLLLNYTILSAGSSTLLGIKLEEMYVKSDDLGNYKGSILVLDNDYSKYHNRILATPYFNPELSAKYFEAMDDYSVVLEVYNNFSSDWPEIIVAKDKTALKKLFDRMPILSTHYQEINTKEGYYKLIK